MKQLKIKMALNKKLKVQDMTSLQMEKQRLRALCEIQEYKLKGHITDLSNNYSKMAINSFLPFKGETKDKVSNALELLNENILPSILGISFKSGSSDLTKNLFKIGQAIVISYSFKFFKKLLNRKKKTEEAK